MRERGQPGRAPPRGRRGRRAVVVAVVVYGTPRRSRRRTGRRVVGAAMDGGGGFGRTGASPELRPKKDKGDGSSAGPCGGTTRGPALSKLQAVPARGAAQLPATNLTEAARTGARVQRSWLMIISDRAAEAWMP